MNKILKEIVSMALIALAVIIILILVFYDYLKVDTEPEMTEAYARTEAVKQIIKEEPEADELIATFAENKTQEIVNKTEDVDTGKEHPFSNTVENIPEENITTQNEIVNETENIIQEIPTKETTTSENTKKQETKKETKKQEEKKQEKKKEKKKEKKPFFDDGTTK